MDQNILEVKDLQISFRTNNGKVQAVRDISFDLKKGETLCIVGESGSGKSVTSRAILGILAGNSIVEGGSIIYGGQDLLRISEDDFHKIRGDKISMIFQDPLSSLNPIVRIGKQLTEAMLLKNRSSRKAARKEFNTLLKLLKDNTIEARIKQGEPAAEVKKQVTEMTETFNKFNEVGLKLENDYNECVNYAAELEGTVEFLLLSNEKQQELDYPAHLRDAAALAKNAVHPFVLSSARMEPLIARLHAEISACDKKSLSQGAQQALEEINAVYNEFNAQEKPNFFTIGYYKMVEKDADIFAMPVQELNEMTRRYLDEHYMLRFIEMEKLGLQNSAQRSLEVKKSVLAELEKSIPVFEQEDLDDKLCKSTCNELAQLVDASIDRLSIQKDSNAYTFRVNLKSAIRKYFDGIKNNPIAQKKYEKQQAKYDAITSKGKLPDWTVTPAALTDLELAKSNILLVLTRLQDSYKMQIENADKIDYDAQAVAFIDYMKARASEVVNKVKKSMAKLRAIRLMEEVGIPEPHKRYKQYPFEFSGGMRQRIVIAIALAANPDILICDEPTTALDVTIQSQILDLINNLKTKRTLSVIFITHDLGVVANMADRVAVMYAGKIVECGTSEDVFYRPAHPYTWALLSSMPDLDTTDKLEAIPGTPPNMIYPPVGDAFAARNKYALQIDFEQQPPMFEISPTHYAATWLLHPDAPEVQPPKIIRDRMERLKQDGGAGNA